MHRNYIAGTDPIEDPEKESYWICIIDMSGNKTMWLMDRTNKEVILGSMNKKKEIVVSSEEAAISTIIRDCQKL